MPGGIKLCSPGTFWVANYLIINNGSCQVNFTKPNSATIRCINSQWLREDASEAPVGKVSVPKIVQKPSSPREDATEVPVGRVPVPKTFRKTAQRPSGNRPKDLPVTCPKGLPETCPNDLPETGRPLPNEWQGLA